MFKKVLVILGLTFFLAVSIVQSNLFKSQPFEAGVKLAKEPVGTESTESDSKSWQPRAGQVPKINNLQLEGNGKSFNFKIITDSGLENDHSRTNAQQTTFENHVATAAADSYARYSPEKTIGSDATNSDSSALTQHSLNAFEQSSSSLGKSFLLSQNFIPEPGAANGKRSNRGQGSTPSLHSKPGNSLLASKGSLPGTNHQSARPNGSPVNTVAPTAGMGNDSPSQDAVVFTGSSDNENGPSYSTQPENNDLIEIPGLNQGEDSEDFLNTTPSTKVVKQETAIATTPEPSTLLLFGTGLLGIAWLGRKRLHKRS